MKSAKKKAATRPAPKTAPKKTAKKKAAPKPAAKKKAAVKKAAPKKVAVRKTTAAVKKAASKKVAAKKTATKSAQPTKAAKKKSAATKSRVVPAKKKSSSVSSGTASKKKAAKKAARTKTARKPAAKPTAKKKAVRKAASSSKAIPSILLEGDTSPASRPSGPGARYDLGPDADRAVGGEDVGELPAAYGTGMVMASARDPHWLYVFWDLTDEQQGDYNRASRDQHLVVRLLNPAAGDQVISATHVHPESRNWFIPVPAAGARYQVELGYHDQQGQWQGIAQSRPVSTPPDELSADTNADFATLPAEVPLEQLISVVRQVVAENVPLMEAIEQLRAEGFAKLPGPDYFREALASTGEPPADLSAEQRAALAEIVTMDKVRRVWIGSQEITELVSRQLTRELSSQAAAAIGLPGGARELSSLSSPFGGGAERAQGFWFNVNAELIIYGATEPDATVTIGDRQIRLRPDGSFSYRFALPDGDYHLPIQATSAAGDDARNADLSFSRGTQYRGDVGTHPQDERLQTPRPEHTA